MFVAIAISPEFGTPPTEFVRGKGDLMPYTVAEDVGDRIDKLWADPLGSSGAGSYPTMAIVDRDGKIAFIGRGYPILGIFQIKLDQLDCIGFVVDHQDLRLHDTLTAY